MSTDALPTSPSPGVDDDAPAHRYTAALANEIELRWQEHWDVNGTFEAPNPAGPLADPDGVAGRGRKLFVLDMFPYPSGTGLHVGHPLGFTGTDVYSRYQRMAGRNVLYTMGFDAFGLPAEQFAVQTGTHPAITTAQNVATYREQIRRIGLSHDRRRSIDTTDPAYYRWTQWIFLQIFESWFDPEMTNPSGSLGCARPISELRAELDAGTRTLDDGREWAALTPSEQAAVIDDHRLAYVSDAPGELVPGTGHRRRQRGGHRRRAQRPRQLPGVQAQHAPVDDAHHGLRRPARRRPRRPRVDRLAEDDAAQLDRAQPRRPRRLRLAGRTDHRLHDAPRHAVRRHVHGPRTRSTRSWPT